MDKAFSKKELGYNRITLIIAIIGLIALFFSDVEISHSDPWLELGRLYKGILSPSLIELPLLLEALAYTISFAFIGVALGAICGFGLSLFYQFRFIRLGCAFLRSIHELFWALIFLQIFGLHPLTGLLALAIPYSATFAKIYSEIFEETTSPSLITLSPKLNKINQLIFIRIPDAFNNLKTYTMYRFECGLRASTVLGFIGLPTLGFYMESAFMEGYYNQLIGFLLLFYTLILSFRYWLILKLVPLYIFISAIFIFQEFSPISWDNFSRFFTQDIIPYPIKNNQTLNETFNWFAQLFQHQMWPGLLNTLILTQVALLLTCILSLFLFPLISKHFFNKPYRVIGHVILVILRSTPEFILAFMFLQIWGPSMLPAIIALSIHNSGVIGHLMGKHSNGLTLRNDSSKGFNLYFYEVLPKSYGQFLSYYFYRWEIIMRETAILGLLGIATLGFYVDSAIQELRFDRAMILILFTAFLNMAIDSISRYFRHRIPKTISLS